MMNNFGVADALANKFGEKKTKPIFSRQ